MKKYIQLFEEYHNFTREDVNEEEKYAENLAQELKNKLSNDFEVDYEPSSGFSGRSYYISISDKNTKTGIGVETQRLFKIRISDHAKPEKYSYLKDNLDLRVSSGYDVEKLSNWIKEKVKEHSKKLSEFKENNNLQGFKNWYSNKNYNDDIPDNLKSDEKIEQEQKEKEKRKKRNEIATEIKEKGLTKEQYNFLLNLEPRHKGDKLNQKAIKDLGYNNAPQKGSSYYKLTGVWASMLLNLGFYDKVKNHIDESGKYQKTSKNRKFVSDNDDKVSKEKQEIEVEQQGKSFHFSSEKAVLDIIYHPDEDFAQIEGMHSNEKGKGYMKEMLKYAINYLNDYYNSGWGQMPVVSGYGRSEEASEFYSKILGEKISNDEAVAYTVIDDEFVRLKEMEDNLW